MREQTFQRVAAVGALVGVAFAIASALLEIVAIPDATDPASAFPAVITHGRTAGMLFHFSMVSDMLGYYLLLIPLAIFLWRWLHHQSPLLCAVSTSAGLGYCLIGAAGAVVLGAVLPALGDQYSTASAAQREVLLTTGTAVANAVYQGIWNTLGAITAGVWWLGTGYLLRSQRTKLGIVWMLTGAASLVDAVGFMTGVPFVGLIGLIPFIVLVPVSAAAVAVDLLRRPVRVGA
ncbi:MAG: DUF4386 domain-containing protein [Candidatus Dormibacteraeota bacterium]|nr:DUF4386 domain-containing protein [Candidatus Dormibacteraeota bacterium]